MREVIYLDKKENEKPVEFTHFLAPMKVYSTDFIYTAESFDKILYVGKHRVHGDMFAAYMDDMIYIYKGHLNSGKY